MIDLRGALTNPAPGGRTMQVARFMTRNPVTVEPDAPLDAAYRLMHEKGFRHLPVATGSEVAGIVSDRAPRRARPHRR